MRIKVRRLDNGVEFWVKSEQKIKFWQGMALKNPGHIEIVEVDKREQ